MFENLFVKEKVMTEQDVKTTLARLRGEKSFKNGLILGGTIGAISLVNQISTFPLTLDSVAINMTKSVSTHLASLSSKMATPVVFPYVATFTIGQLYSGAFALITLLLIVVVMKDKKEDKTALEILADCAMVLAAPILWILI